MFFVDWELGGRKKNFRGRDFFLNKNLVRVGLQETNNFFWGLSIRINLINSVKPLRVDTLPRAALTDQELEWLEY